LSFSSDSPNEVLKGLSFVESYHDYYDSIVKKRTKTFYFVKTESKLRWRTPLQATGYVRATAPNSVKGNNNPNTIYSSKS
jgi:hypothetical protein